MLRYLPTVVLIGFTLYCLIDLIRSRDDEVRSLPRPAWLLLVILLPVVGGVAWLIAGRPRTARAAGTPGPRSAASPPVLGPDDDPEFLRGLNRTDGPERTERGRDSEDGGGAADEGRR